MKRITIAVLTDHIYVFGDLQRSEGNIDYVRVRNIEDIRGRLFDGYCVIGSLYTIKDAHELIRAIKTRLK